MENKDNIKSTTDSSKSVNDSAPIDNAMPDISSTIWTTYVPRFTEASDNYRAMGDPRLRAKINDGDSVEVTRIANPDEIRLDPTAEFEADVNGTDAKAPENKALDEHDESISIYKFTEEAEPEIEDAAEREAREESDMLEEIRQLLGSNSTPVSQPTVVEEEVIEEIPEEIEVIEDAVNHQLLIGIYDNGKGMTPDFLVTSFWPNEEACRKNYHPGALKYFDERGITLKSVSDSYKK